MSDDEKLEIKNKIGSVILAHLKMRTVRIILKKPSAQRSNQDIKHLSQYLKSLPIFKKYDQLTEYDFNDLAMSMKYKEYDQDTVIYRIG